MADSSTPDLFASSSNAERLSDLKQRFELWIDHRKAAPSSAQRAARALREESAEVYRDMWGEFAAWCIDHDVDLETIDQTSIDAFLASIGGPGLATPRYLRRMLRLIARIDAFDSERSGRPANAGLLALMSDPRYRFADSESQDQQPEFLTARESAALIAFVTERHANANPARNWKWQTVRDRTAVALQLGAGITPGEVLALKVHAAIVTGGRVRNEPWALKVPGNGNRPARQTPLPAWAGRQLAYWLKVRGEHAITGDVMFPATRSGRKWSKNGGFKSVRAVMRDAGLAQTAGGSFKLRHTFALRQLSHGHAPEQVALWLGVDDPETMERYRRVIFRPVDVV